jgi:hypothetical protein
MLPYVIQGLTVKHSTVGPQIIQGDLRGKVNCIGGKSNGLMGKRC